MMRKFRKIRSRSGGKCRQGRAASRRKLGFQTLELRRLMAGDIGMTDGVITIMGSDHDDTVDVYTEGEQVVVSTAEYGADGVVEQSTSKSFSREDVRGIHFRGGGGDDVFVNDTDIRAVAMGGDGDDVLVGGGGRDVLHGGGGDDLLLGTQDRMMGGAGENAIVPIGLGTPKDEPTPSSDAPVADGAGEVGDTPSDEQTASTQETVEADDVVTPVETSIESGEVAESAATPGNVSESDDGEDDAIDRSSTADSDADQIETSPLAVTLTSSFTFLANRFGLGENASMSATSVAVLAPMKDAPGDDYGPDPEDSQQRLAGPCPAEDGILSQPVVDDVAEVVDDLPVPDQPPAPPIVPAVPTDVEPSTDQESETPSIAGDGLSDPPGPSTPIGGDDIVVGGDGRDLIFGGPGDDLLFGDALSDGLLDRLLANYLGDRATSLVDG